jgi:hypothetical protein
MSVVVPLIIVGAVFFFVGIVGGTLCCAKRAYAKNTAAAAAGFANLPHDKAMTTEQGLACVGFSSSEMPSSLEAYLSEEEFMKRV